MMDAAQHTADGVTIAIPAAPNVTLAKIVRVDQDGRLVDKEPSPNVTLHRFAEVRVDGLDRLAEVLQDGARRGAIAVRAKPKGRRGRRAIYDDAERGPAGLGVVPRRWCGLDFDDLPLEPQSDPLAPELADDPAEFANWSLPDPALDPEIGARAALRRLPPAFRGASCLWQVTASAGFGEGFRLRTWHWLDRPATGDQLKAWLWPAIERGFLDPVTLREAQTHYLGVRVIGGPDPCPRRWGILRADRDTVTVPDLEAMQQERARRERISRPPAPPPDSDQGGSYAERRIGDCLAAIRSAPDGTKHPTYVAEAAPC